MEEKKVTNNMKKNVLIMILVIICIVLVSVVIISSVSGDKGSNENKNANEAIENYTKNVQNRDANKLSEMVNLEELSEFADQKFEREEIANCFNGFLHWISSYSVNKVSEVKDYSDIGFDDEQIVQEKIIDKNYKTYKIESTITNTGNETTDYTDIVILDENFDIVYSNSIAVGMYSSAREVDIQNKVNR